MTTYAITSRESDDWLPITATTLDDAKNEASLKLGYYPGAVLFIGIVEPNYIRPTAIKVGKGNWHDFYARNFRE